MYFKIKRHRSHDFHLQDELTDPKEQALFYRFKAKFFLELRDFEQAEKLFNLSLNTDPECYSSLSGLGKALRAHRKAEDRFQIPDLRERDCFRDKFEKTDDPRAAVRLAVTEMEELLNLGRMVSMDKEEVGSRSFLLGFLRVLA
jgi:hypothetical protein